jgi:DNA mismatch repair protein MutS
MTFQSILFENVADPISDEHLRAPDFFADLHLDQIVTAITAGKEQYNLTPFFYVPLHDVAAVAYRHEVMQNLEDACLFDNIKAFAHGMRDVHERLSQLENHHYEHQKERWFLDAVDLYGDTVNRLVRDLNLSQPSSRGLRTFRHYLAQYASSQRFTSLVDEAKRLEAELSAIRYSVLMHRARVEVHHHAGKSDYSAEVQATFGRFQQTVVQQYTFSFSDSLEMNHIEAKILDGVVQLHPDTFSRLGNFCASNKDFLDPTIVAFDREIQFYVAYLEYIATLKKAGLNFCYPRISGLRKDVYDYHGFDLALAGTLISEHTTPVCNDFYLKDPERIIVVSGPNQGGKTTFARTFGQLHYLASLGCPVPGTKARLYLCDRIFTHFEREEHMTSLRGKLEDDIQRIHHILEAATPGSIIIINEIFASTALRDAIFLSRKIAATIMELDVLCVWVTFIDEVASLSEHTVSMVSTVVPENPAQRTFKIIRRPADGLAFAMSLAEKYRLTYQMIRERIGS